jgi:phosphoglycolate phosphatase
MRYDLIVWDFDGTLADTFDLTVSVYNDLALRHGLRPVESPASLRGLTTRAFLRRHNIPLLRLPRLLREHQAAARGRMGSVRLFDGVPDLLRRLRAGGCRLAVLSSNAAENIQGCLAANGVEGLFEFVVGYPRLFGKGVVLRRLLRREGLAPSRLLYVGDEVRDVRAASRAGVDSAAVSWGFQAPELLARLGPTYLWSDPGEALAVLLAGGHADSA